MKKNKTYTFIQIEDFANGNDFQIYEYGSNTIGRAFILLDHDQKDCCISFVLTGSGSNGFEYECIYSDSE